MADYPKGLAITWSKNDVDLLELTLALLVCFAACCGEVILTNFNFEVSQPELDFSLHCHPTRHTSFGRTNSNPNVFLPDSNDFWGNIVSMHERWETKGVRQPKALSPLPSKCGDFEFQVAAAHCQLFCGRITAWLQLATQCLTCWAGWECADKWILIFLQRHNGKPLDGWRIAHTCKGTVNRAHNKCFCHESSYPTLEPLNEKLCLITGNVTISKQLSCW